MRQKIIIAVICSFLMSGCSTYAGPGGHTHVGDPSVCGADTGFCDMVVVGALAAVCFAVAASAH